MSSPKGRDHVPVYSGPELALGITILVQQEIHLVTMTAPGPDPARRYVFGIRRRDFIPPHNIPYPTTASAGNVLAVFKSFAREPRINFTLFAQWVRVSPHEARMIWTRLRFQYRLFDERIRTAPRELFDNREDFRNLIKAAWSFYELPLVPHPIL
ncbi:hypothetical protein NPX13_g2968 [Xylaria arbuscula]|uniref:Uncharacterized protein n=1 Tax=Xylaria arbuscula TaxID=114810 RepID=A0A9W8NIP7_9PEZI|nr:hypothetical protein NPX13_g2968 [Xylaria arbuscula]